MRRKRHGFATSAGASNEGFFIPYPGAPSLEPLDYPALRPLFEAAVPAFRTVMATIEAHAADLDRVVRGGPGLVGERVARFGQDWFPRLDAAAAYAIVRSERPRTIIEVGSGHSTRFLAQAVADGGFRSDMTCIDPQPRAPLGGLKLRHAARQFGPADSVVAADLAAGDVLFVDSSHVAMPGTEVDRLLLDVLPRLRAGVLVHFHDIFLPDGYPKAWARRNYNEQLPIGTLLQGGAFALVFASRFVACHTNLLTGSLVESLPLGPGVPEASLWLRKT